MDPKFYGLETLEEDINDIVDRLLFEKGKINNHISN